MNLRGNLFVRGFAGVPEAMAVSLEVVRSPKWVLPIEGFGLQ